MLGSTDRFCKWSAVFILLLVYLLPYSASAHSPRENYVWVNVESDHISGRFEISLTDIEQYLGVDIDAVEDDRLAGAKATAATVQSYLLKNFSLTDGATDLELEFLEPSLFTERSLYVQYPFRTPLPQNNKLTVTNSIFLTSDLPEFDRLHRSLLVIEYNRTADKEFGAENVALVFSGQKNIQEIDLVNPAKILQWRDFLWQGMLHIWLGLDHLLFVALFLLISVVRPVGNRWEPQPGFVPALWQTLKIVTVFTLAHTITLTLATLDIFRLNSRLVESVIALSIIAVALMNMAPRYSVHNWKLIFLFGLFHGLGFATVLGDLPFRNVMLERILLMFNVGVEVGQLVVVALVFPLLFLLRRWQYYTSVVVVPVSCLAIVIASVWIVERLGFSIG